MRRVVSMPLMPGMRTSISTTSGTSSCARSSAVAAVGRLADDLHALVELEHQHQPASEHGVVIADEHADHWLSVPVFGDRIGRHCWFVPLVATLRERADANRPRR